MVFTSIPGISPIDITSFGAVADNLDSSAAANDAAFTRAYNAVVSAGGGVIQVPWGATGIYRTNTGWVIDHDNVSLVGLGTRLGSPTIQIASTKDPTYALVVGNTKNVNDCLIDGLNIQGLANNTSTGGGVNFRCIGGKVRQCRVANFGGTGINLAAFSSTIYEPLLEDITLIQNGRNSGTPGDNLFIANTVTDFEVIRLLTFGNAAQNMTRHAINCAGGPGKFLVCHPYFANLNGLLITGNGNIQVIGGEYETNGNAGISVQANQVLIEGATFFGNTNKDIETFNLCSIKGCSFESTANGIYSTFASGDISGNLFVGQGSVPINLDTSTMLMSVHDNYIQNGDPGIRIAGTLCDVHDNVIVAGGIAEITGANNNDIHDNFISAGKTITIIGSTTRVRNNPGYNPVGSVSTPAFPASTVGVVNTTGVDVTAYVVNGANAITVISIAGANGTYTATGQTIGVAGEGVFRLPVGAGIKFTYAGGSPTWTWFGD